MTIINVASLETYLYLLLGVVSPSYNFGGKFVKKFKHVEFEVHTIL